MPAVVAFGSVTGVPLTVLSGGAVLMLLWLFVRYLTRLRFRRPGGIHSGAEGALDQETRAARARKCQDESLDGRHRTYTAQRWASTRFPAHLQPIAAYVADLLCDQVGVKISEIEPQMTFTVDLRMDEETVEFVMALEEGLEISIPDEDCGALKTVADLVEYIYRRITPVSELVEDRPVGD